MIEPSSQVVSPREAAVAGSPLSARTERAEGAHAFATYVDNGVRTRGVVIHRPMRGAADLSGLDLPGLAEVATGQGDAAARGKVAHLGRDGALVLQTSPRATPEVVWCGNATAAVALMSRCKSGSIRLFGPAGKSARVSFSTTDVTVEQFWTLPPPSYSEEPWLGTTVLRSDVLNSYAVVLGSLPDCVTPEAARRLLVGPELGTKLAIVTKRSTGQAHVSFYNAGGAHGAAPLSGLGTLAILVHLSASIANFVSDGTVTFGTGSGPVTVLLPDVRFRADGSVTITMPTVDVRLSPLVIRDPR